MMIINNEDITRMFKDIMEKKLNNKFISAGTILRFRDKCIMVGYLKAQEEMKEMIEDLEKQLINRMCCPNKPVNTFENAREQEEVINEEFKELLSKIGDNSEVEK